MLQIAKARAALNAPLFDFCAAIERSIFATCWQANGLVYTIFSRILALAKSMIVTTMTIAMTAVPTDRYLLKAK